MLGLLLAGVVSIAAEKDLGLQLAENPPMEIIARTPPEPEPATDDFEVRPGYNVISSLDEFRAVIKKSGQKIRMKPGVYRAEKSDPPITFKAKNGVPSRGNDREENEQDHIFTVTGSRNRFDLRGVVIETPVSLQGALSGKVHVADSWHINGDKNTFIGGYFRNVIDKPYPDFRSTECEFEICGDGNAFYNCTFVIRGSIPFGYTDFYGKGGTHYGRMNKHSFMSILNANDTKLVGCKVYQQSFGHGLHLHNVDGVLVKDCYFTGALRPTNDIFNEKAGHAVDHNFEMMYRKQQPIPRNWMIPLTEDGIRAYNDVRNVTVENTTVERFRGCFQLLCPEGDITLENVTVLEAGDFAYDLSVGDEGKVAMKNCRADLSHNPVFNLTRGDTPTDAFYELTVLDPPEGFVPTPRSGLGIICGNDSEFILHDGTTRPIPASINVLYCGGRKGMDDSEVVNYTQAKLILASNVRNCTIKSVGEVEDNGSNNRIVKLDPPKKPVAKETIVASEPVPVLDTLVLGDVASERVHQLEAVQSDVVDGALGVKARQLLANGEWRGGKVTFKMKVDPEKPNYFTAKFWGGDRCSDEQHEQRLCLYVEGKQLGTRHLGEIDMLDIMKYDLGRYPGRFLYTTRPLPLHMTQGKTEVELTIEGQGGINGYASKIEDYQKMMTEPSRGIYRAYTHTNPCFEPLEGEVQGAPPSTVPVRPEPGIEVIERLKKELNDRSDMEMARGGKKHEYNIQYLAHAYKTPWNTAYNNKNALERIVEAIDAHYLEFRENSGKIEGVRWIFKGPIGDAIRLVHEDLEPWLDEDVPGTSTKRRKAWAELMEASRNHNCSKEGEGRRSYTNQCLIKDQNTYYCNLAIRLIHPSKAWPESKARLMLYEAMGLEPFSGNWDEYGNPEWNQGKSKMLLTEMGLTKELGYVGAYGEIISDSGFEVYEATKSSPEGGDKRIREQLVKMMRARAPFRYPLVDKDGFRSMNQEALIGWRDWKYPGNVIYDQTNGRDGGAFQVAVSTGDKVLLGYGQQMLEDNQYFVALKERMESHHTNSKTYLLNVPELYEYVSGLPKQPYRLPMTPGQPDFVFADPGDGVIAFKDRGDIFYVSLYWRARRAVNNLARVHYLTPRIERDAIVDIETEFEDSGNTYTFPERTNMEFARGREERWYTNQGIYQAMAGVEQPIAKVRGDDSYEVGQEHIQAGKAQLYTLEYGNYFIAMNCDGKESFRVDLPEAFVGAKDLVSKQLVKFPKANLKPGKTIVLCKDWNIERPKPVEAVVAAPVESQVEKATEAPVVPAVAKTKEAVRPKPEPVVLDEIAEEPQWKAWLADNKMMAIIAGSSLLLFVMFLGLFKRK